MLSVVFCCYLTLITVWSFVVLLLLHCDKMLSFVVLLLLHCDNNAVFCVLWLLHCNNKVLQFYCYNTVTTMLSVVVFVVTILPGCCCYYSVITSVIFLLLLHSVNNAVYCSLSYKYSVAINDVFDMLLYVAFLWKLREYSDYSRAFRSSAARRF